MFTQPSILTKRFAAFGAVLAGLASTVLGVLVSYNSEAEQRLEGKYLLSDYRHLQNARVNAKCHQTKLQPVKKNADAH